MLVLSRKLGERILVPGCKLTVTVMAVKGSRVRLGISAPAGIGVFREEIWKKIQLEELEGRPGLKERHPECVGGAKFASMREGQGRLPK